MIVRLLGRRIRRRQIKKKEIESLRGIRKECPFSLPVPPVASIPSLPIHHDSME
jgi:hypothetical protein